jgi:hypothetical protein
MQYNTPQSSSTLSELDLKPNVCDHLIIKKLEKYGVRRMDFSPAVLM